MRTLRDMNLSKYVAEDVPLFLSLISDLFPGITAEKSKHPVVEQALSETIPTYGLLPHPAWHEKIIQVREIWPSQPKPNLNPNPNRNPTATPTQPQPQPRSQR